jgi:hypothetical protein
MINKYNTNTNERSSKAISNRRGRWYRVYRGEANQPAVTIRVSKGLDSVEVR